MNLLRQKKGKTGEKLSLNYLLRLNHSIVSKNFRTKFGEIDLITRKGNCLYFIEIKTRETDTKGMPYEAVDARKLTHMKKAVQQFLLQNPHKEYKLKLAVISILLDKNDIKFWDDIEF